MEITFVGWAGILLGFSAVILVMRRDRSLDTLALSLSLAAVQVVVAVYFYHWAQTNTSDAIMYYHDPYDFFSRGFGLNTQFVIWLIHTLRGWFGGTYLDYFLLFQASGTWGIIFLLKTFEDVFGQIGTKPPRKLFLLLFLPGLHFWTAFIGKDGALFLGAALTVWATVNIRTRWMAFGVGLALMIMFRPHIALIAVASLAISVVLDGRTPFLTKLGLGFLAVGGFIFAAATVQSTFQVDITNADSVSDFVTTQSELSDRVAGGTTVAISSFPLRVLSLLFRPLFFDAGGMPGLIASFENLVLLIIVLAMLYRFGWVVALFRRSFLVRYSLIFAVAVIIALSMVYYNVGLGLRQKMMMMPALLTVYAGVVAVGRVRVQQKIRMRPQPA